MSLYFEKDKRKTYGNQWISLEKTTLLPLNDILLITTSIMSHWINGKIDTQTIKKNRIGWLNTYPKINKTHELLNTNLASEFHKKWLRPTYWINKIKINTGMMTFIEKLSSYDMILNVPLLEIK